MGRKRRSLRSNSAYSAEAVIASLLREDGETSNRKYLLLERADEKTLVLKIEESLLEPLGKFFKQKRRQEVVAAGYLVPVWGDVQPVLLLEREDGNIFHLMVEEDRLEEFLAVRLSEEGPKSKAAAAEAEEAETQRKREKPAASLLRTKHQHQQEQQEEEREKEREERKEEWTQNSFNTLWDTENQQRTIKTEANASEVPVIEIDDIVMESL